MHTEAFQDQSYLPQMQNETKLSELQLPYEVKLGFFLCKDSTKSHKKTILSTLAELYVINWMSLNVNWLSVSFDEL